MRVPLEYHNLPERPRADGEPARHASKCALRGPSGAIGRLHAGRSRGGAGPARRRAPGTRLFHLLADEVRVPYGVSGRAGEPGGDPADLRAVGRRDRCRSCPSSTASRRRATAIGRIMSTPEQVVMVGPTSHVVGVDERDHRAGVGGERHHQRASIASLSASPTSWCGSTSRRPPPSPWRSWRSAEEKRLDRRGAWRRGGSPMAARRSVEPATRGRDAARTRARLAPLDPVAALRRRDGPDARPRTRCRSRSIPSPTWSSWRVEPATRRGADPLGGTAGPCLSAGRCGEHGAISDMSKLFGTDGVRGVAGDAAARSRDGGATRRGARARAAASRRRPHPGRARHARVGRLDRAGAGPRRRQPGRAARLDRHRADAGGRVPDRVARLRRRHRHLGVAQSVPGQRHQGLLRPRRRSSPRRRSATSKSLVADPTFRVDADDAGDGRRARISSAPTSITRKAALPSTGALRGARIGLDCANGATATVAPRLFRELGFDVVVIGVEPDGRNINLECGSTHPECLAALVQQGAAALRRRLRRRRRSRDPDRRRRQGRRRRRRALPVREAHARRRPPQGRRHRRHRDEQHRPRDRAARSRHRHAALPGRRQVRDGGARAARPRRSAASSRATSSSPSTSSPATASSPRCRWCARWSTPGASCRRSPASW